MVVGCGQVSVRIVVVLKWIVDRINGEAEVTETPIGFVPAKNAIDTSWHRRY